MKAPTGFPPVPARVAQARALQERLRSRVRLEPLPPGVRYVAAADVTDLGASGDVAAAVVLWDLRTGAAVEERSAVRRSAFPYVPGYLSFREGPAVLAALRRLRRPPDVVLLDGHGIAHPRRFGIASHVGVLLDVPTVGCAKRRLVGEAAEPGPRRGDAAPLTLEGETVGAVLRTREGVKPVFVSPGHRADLPTSVRLVLSLCSRYRLPDPARRAHGLTRTLRAGGRVSP